MTDADDHSPMANGVSEYDIEETMKYSIGHLLDGIPETYEKYGPPPIASYLTCAEYSFKIGFEFGYRRAHIDQTHES
jgi:hypothetical protein